MAAIGITSIHSIFQWIILYSLSVRLTGYSFISG